MIDVRNCKRSAAGALAAVFVALPAAAFAGCPGPEDLGGAGIWVGADDGAVTHYQQQPDKSVFETTVFDDGTGFWVRSVGGLYVVESGDVANGKRDPVSVTRYEFPIAPDTLPRPGPDAYWAGDIRVYEGDAAPVIEGYLMRALGASELKVGACAYGSRVVRSEYLQGDGSGSASDLHYLSDLGISILVAGGDPGKPPSEFYFVTSISNEPPE